MSNIAEKAVLGTCLIHNYLILDSGLIPEHFENGLHRTLFKNMRELVQQKKPVDVITLMSVGDHEENLLNYLAELRDCENESKFDEYVELVIDRWRESKKRHILAQAIEQGWSDEKILMELNKIANNRVDDHKSIREVLAAYMQVPFEKRPVQKGIPTGIEQLDVLLNGFQPKELIIVAARPSMGKTDVMLHFAKHAGWNGYLPIVFSLEMSTEKLTERLIASTGDYNRSKMRNPEKELTEGQKKKWTSVLGELDKANIQFFDSPGQKVSEMRMKLRKLISEYTNLKPIVFVDYLTIIKSDNTQNNKHLEVGEIAQSLKNMAKEFNCPVVSLAQLSRKIEERGDKRPMNSDLRESGNIEEIADVIIGLYRESYYKQTDDEHSLELLINKNRNGECKMIEVRYNRFVGGIK